MVTTAIKKKKAHKQVFFKSYGNTMSRNAIPGAKIHNILYIKVFTTFQLFQGKQSYVAEGVQKSPKRTENCLTRQHPLHFTNQWQKCAAATTPSLAYARAAEGSQQSSSKASIYFPSLLVGFGS